jgi:hypothetical protein
MTKYLANQFLGRLLPLSAALSIGVSIAQEMPRFLIDRFSVESNPLLEQADVDADKAPWEIGATLDSTGSGQTGSGRLSIPYQNSNLFDSDQILTLQYQTSVKNPKDLSVAAVSYRTSVSQ